MENLHTLCVELSPSPEVELTFNSYFGMVIGIETIVILFWSRNFYHYSQYWNWLSILEEELELKVMELELKWIWFGFGVGIVNEFHRIINGFECFVIAVGIGTHEANILIKTN